MTDSPGPLITQLQKAPFTWALGRCHWWGILGHQQMSRAAWGLSPAPWCGLPTAVLPQDLDTAIRVLSTLLSWLVSHDLPDWTPVQPGGSMCLLPHTSTWQHAWPSVHAQRLFWEIWNEVKYCQTKRRENKRIDNLFFHSYASLYERFVSLMGGHFPKSALGCLLFMLLP